MSSRHNVFADDSVPVNFIVPKALKDRVAAAKGSGETISDALRKCVAVGIVKLENDKRRAEERLAKRKETVNESGAECDRESDGQTDDGQVQG